MTERDWQAFGDALQTVFPRARYYRDIERGVKTPEPPALVLYPHLRAMPAEYHDDVTMVFDPFWQPRFIKTHFLESVYPDKWHWTLLPPAYPLVYFRFGNAIWLNQGPPHHGVGMIDFYMTPKDREHVALMRRFFHLFGKFATNRGLAWVRYPDYLTHPVEKGLDCWCGYDALRWVREDPKRFLHLNGISGLRPLDAMADVVPLRPPMGKP